MRILIADDTKDFAAFLERLVRGLEHEVAEVVTSGGLGVIQAYDRHKPDLVLMDFRMPRFNGMTACRHILSKDSSARIVVMSGDVNQTGLLAAAARVGAIGTIRKPFSQPELRVLLEWLTEEMANGRENTAKYSDSHRPARADREHVFTAVTTEASHV